MYKVLIKNLEGFEIYFKNDERIELVKPFFLLKDINLFNYHKLQNTNDYQNLQVIIKKAMLLKEINKYHSFGMLVNELELQYFEFQLTTPVEINVNPDVLDYQISLLHQFTFPAYYN